MSIVVSSNGGSKLPLHPAGAYAVRCVRIVDLGTQTGEYQGKPKVARKVRFVWESAEKMGDEAGDFAGKPFLLTQDFTASLSDRAAMKKALESWRGRPFTKQELEGFDLKNVLGKACLVNLIHSTPKDTTYCNIASIMPLPSGMTCHKAVTEEIFFSLNDFDQALFDKLSDRLKETIAKSPEYAAATSTKPASQTKSAVAAPDMDDDIPF